VVDALRQDIQGAEDDEGLVALCDEAGDIVYDRRSIALQYTRALAKVGRLADAEAVVRNMHIAAPDDIDILANYAMIAAQNGNFRLALELYGRLSEMSTDSTERYHHRIEAFLSSAGRRGIRYVRGMVAAGQFDNAVTTYRLLSAFTLLPQQQLAEEATRILSGLRVHLRRLDEEEASSHEILDVITLMLNLAPDDPRVLRRAGLEYMKVEEFQKALDFWRRLQAVSPDAQSAANIINRCEILAARQSRQGRAKPVAVSLAA
jgi:Flp pilus assembly protein TadD